MLKEYHLSPADEARLRTEVDQLEQQAEFYGMDTDLETFKLVAKPTFRKPVWKERWEASRAAMDLDEHFDMDREE